MQFRSSRKITASSRGIFKITKICYNKKIGNWIIWGETKLGIGGGSTTSGRWINWLTRSARRTKRIGASTNSLIKRTLKFNNWKAICINQSRSCNKARSQCPKADWSHITATIWSTTRVFITLNKRKSRIYKTRLKNSRKRFINWKEIWTS